ncbi:MAG: GAF domain-containing protein [Anaerolineae bacterium]|nr:GAF domain-containing protein [Anaerolineae bacterium]
MTMDDTTRIESSRQNAHSSVRQLLERIDQLTRLLRSQQDALRRRGMNLPPSALQALQALHEQVEPFSKHIEASTVQLRHLHALADTSALVNSSLDTSEVLERVMDTVIQLSGAERGFIMLKNKQSSELEFVVSRGIDENDISHNRFMVSRTITNRVAETGLPELTSNASNDPRYQGNESIVANALRSIIAIPLQARGEVIGVVYCDNRFLAGVFKQHDLDLVTDFANQAAVAIENARLFESARQRLAEVKATSDMITNVLASIASGVISIDLKGMISTCNPVAEMLLAQTDDGVIGKSLRELLPATIDRSFYQSLDYVYDTGEQRTLALEPVLEGRPRYWNVIISTLRDYSGQVQGLTIVLDDLTEIRRQQEQVQEASRYLPPALVKNLRTIDVAGVSGEERIITSFSADVRGFTTFSERLEPEALMQIINSYLSLASDAINLYEGVVDKFLGDAVTGLFNTQLHPQPDHAMRAVRAAMNLMLDLQALHEVMPDTQRLYYGVGIHTGPAVLGNVGSPDRREFAAIGEATAVSKILESNARGGEIVISPATYELVESHYECEPFAPEKTKGRDDLTLAYRVIKRKQGTSPLTLDDF